MTTIQGWKCGERHWRIVAIGQIMGVYLSLQFFNDVPIWNRWEEFSGITVNHIPSLWNKLTGKASFEFRIYSAITSLRNISNSWAADHLHRELHEVQAENVGHNWEFQELPFIDETK